MISGRAGGPKPVSSWFFLGAEARTTPRPLWMPTDVDRDPAHRAWGGVTCRYTEAIGRLLVSSHPQVWHGIGPWGDIERHRRHSSRSLEPSDRSTYRCAQRPTLEGGTVPCAAICGHRRRPGPQRAIARSALGPPPRGEWRRKWGTTAYVSPFARRPARRCSSESASPGPSQASLRKPL